MSFLLEALAARDEEEAGPVLVRPFGRGWEITGADVPRASERVTARHRKQKSGCSEGVRSISIEFARVRPSPLIVYVRTD